jgi:predicted ABC-type ATPase
VVKLFYLWLPSAEVAVRRVRERVRKGGQDVPAADVRRRFERSLTNLARHYLPLADELSIVDNSGPPSRLIAAGTKEHLTVVDEGLFAAITSRRT